MDKLDPLSRAYISYRRKRYNDVVEICSVLLAHNCLDQAAFLLKCKAISAMSAIDRTDIDEEVAGDLLLDNHSTATTARQGTAINRKATAARPMTKGGRPVTGFIRPGTQGRLNTSRREALQTSGVRQGTARPLTSSGRVMRLGTASMAQLQKGGEIDLAAIDVQKYGARHTSKILADYLVDVSNEPARAVELATVALTHTPNDAFWIHRLARAYYALGALAEAERHYVKAIDMAPSVGLYAEYSRVFMRRDQPLGARELLDRGLQTFPAAPTLLLCQARVADALGDVLAAEKLYQAVTRADPTNVEAVASLGANAFYFDRYELALRLYSRLIHMDAGSSPVWCNIGLCCHHIGQSDLALQAFQRSLLRASSADLPDVWYNISHVALSLGEMGLARHALHCCLAFDPMHHGALNNLGVLEMRAGNVEAARLHYAAGMDGDGHEPELNQALLAYKLGNVEAAYRLVQGVLDGCPDEQQALQLKLKIEGDFLN